jgi:hypothetical protein
MTMNDEDYSKITVSRTILESRGHHMSDHEWWRLRLKISNLVLKDAVLKKTKERMLIKRDSLTVACWNHWHWWTSIDTSEGRAYYIGPLVIHWKFKENKS